ncbi:MAG: tetratricopeptide repeat protein [Rhizobacter sp.]|jgi:predicted negative regulator of RcsB-dependent stress response
MQETQQNKSFIQEWGVLIAFAVIAIASLGGFRIWTEHKANQPVSEAYRIYLDQLSSNSKNAEAFLQDYYAKYSRRTVASKHFESVCGAATALADHDGFNPEKVSEQMARACRMFAPNGVTGSIP